MVRYTTRAYPACLPPPTDFTSLFRGAVTLLRYAKRPAPSPFSKDIRALIITGEIFSGCLNIGLTICNNKQATYAALSPLSPAPTSTSLEIKSTLTMCCRLRDQLFRSWRSCVYRIIAFILYSSYFVRVGHCWDCLLYSQIKMLCLRVALFAIMYWIFCKIIDF